MLCPGREAVRRGQVNCVFYLNQPMLPPYRGLYMYEIFFTSTFFRDHEGRKGQCNIREEQKAGVWPDRIIGNYA